MKVKQNQDLSRYLENWPEHYKELKGPMQREQALQTMIEKQADQADQRRLEVFRQRYGASRSSNRPDHFMHAFLMMKVLAGKKLNVMNRRSMESEYRSYLKELGICEHPDQALLEEWTFFAEDYTALALSSSAKPQFLGMAKRDEHTAAQHVAEEINLVTAELPERFELKPLLQPLRSIMIETYCTQVEQGREIWHQYFETAEEKH